MKTCNGEGERICRVEFESSCSTRQVESKDGSRLDETKCEKIPVDICGAGCVTREGDQVLIHSSLMS